MKQLFQIGFIVFCLCFGVVSTASAQKLRRPYSASLAFNYGFDNRSGGGCRDWNCGTLCYDGHGGTDQPTPFGTNILAGAGGRVTATNNTCPDYGAVGNTCGGRCGNYVQITHDDGSVAIYCHLKRNSLVVSSGTRVSCGQKIAQSASSGSSSGPHLHLGWKRSAGAASQDSFRGSCTSSPGCWVQQNGYRSAVGATCAVTCQPKTEVCDGKDNDCDGKIDEGVKNACGKCGAVPKEVCDGKDNDCDGKIDEGVANACGKCGAVPREVCDGKDNDCDGQTDEGELCEIDWLNNEAGMYAPTRTSDVDGDGRADVCARGKVGLWCHLANGDGFDLDPRTEVVPLTAAKGWDDASHYSTIRMGDVDGDGLADVCARGVDGVTCWASDGKGGWEAFDGPALADARGWAKPGHYTTLRLADVTGDGRDDLCARAARGLLCWPSEGRSFGSSFDGPLWSNEKGYNSAKYYGTLRFGDFNGDGKADACMRDKNGYWCAPSTGAGFGPVVLVASWKDESGWNKMHYWATITMLDFDGDGLADVCARRSTDFRCVLSRGESFEGVQVVAELANDSGWSDQSNWSTLRSGDINGDGREDVCARANAGIRCWSWDGEKIVGHVGPRWSDELSWDAEQVYATIRMGDIDGDGLIDICARAHAGWRCHLATGGDFSPTSVQQLAEFKSASGWSAPRYWSTIRLGGPSCVPEVCDGKDNDCDGLVDDDPAGEAEPCELAQADPCFEGLTVCDGGAMRCEAMRRDTPECTTVPEPDMGMMPVEPADMGMSVDQGEDLPPEDLGSDGAGAQDMGAMEEDDGGSELVSEGGCACDTGAAPRAPQATWLLLLGGLLWMRRRTSRRAA